MTNQITSRAMLTPRGNRAKDQFIVQHTEVFGTHEFEVKKFVSYGTVIVKQVTIQIPGKRSKLITCLDETYWEYSKTTSQYRSKFLDESTADTFAKIQAQEYYLVNLNLGD